MRPLVYFLHQYSSLRREERLAAQIAWSREMRQDSYSRGREEFLASTISSAVGSGGLSSGSGGTHGGGGGSDRDRSMGMFSRLPVSHVLALQSASYPRFQISINTSCKYWSLRRYRVFCILLRSIS